VPIRLLLVDDHWLVREGLRVFFGSDPDVEVVGEASDGQQAVELARNLSPDVVLMDIVMPVTDGISATETISRELPGSHVVMLTGYVSDHLITKALRAGAVGYMLKDVAADQLWGAVRAAAAGQVQLSPVAVAHLVGEVEAPATSIQLTARETEVLILLAAGRSNQQIAGELHITEQTVKTHVSSVLNKLGVRSRTEAALHAIRSGLVSADRGRPT
jgi:two-component system, NarL family, response regulator LiaR